MEINLITICSGNKNKIKDSAINVYKGEYWNVIKQISPKIKETYIISAKYGLITKDNIIEPYELSFKPDDKNFIKFKLNINPKEYWNDNFKNQISNLISSKPNEIFLIYLSFSYVKAIYDDLINIISNKNVFLFSPDTNLKKINPYIINTSLKLTNVLGGNKFSITSLCIKYLIENLDKISLNREEINKHFYELYKDYPEYNYIPSKTKINDNELINIINNIGINTSKTKLLKKIYSMGYACGPCRLNKILNSLKNNYYV